MVKQILYYYTDSDIPDDKELLECLEVQKNNPDKIVVLKYFKRWSGGYEVWFNGKTTLEEVIDSMPKVYGL